MSMSKEEAKKLAKENLSKVTAIGNKPEMTQEDVAECARLMKEYNRLMDIVFK